MARNLRKSTTNKKAGQARTLGKTAVALALTALLEAAVKKVMNDPKFRRKAWALVEEAGTRTKAAGKKVSRAVRSKKRKRG